jgi:hypothetical protein
MDGPTAEQLAEFRRLRQKVRDAYDSGAPDEAAEKQLDDFVKQTGFANEAPSDLFDPSEIDPSDDTSHD